MAFSVIGYSMMFESRRYNQSETRKEIYERRKQEMNEVLESDAWKRYMEKNKAEYLAAQKSDKNPLTNS